MNTNFSTLFDNMISFLSINAKNMLKEGYEDDGTVFTYNLPNQLALELCFDEEGNLEASLRVKDSSYFCWDWEYVDEGSFMCLESIEDIPSVAEYFLEYLKEEEKRSDLIGQITDVMDYGNVTEFSVEYSDKTEITVFYNLRTMASKIENQIGENLTWRIELDKLEKILSDLKESEDY